MIQNGEDHAKLKEVSSSFFLILGEMLANYTHRGILVLFLLTLLFSACTVLDENIIKPTSGFQTVPQIAIISTVTPAAANDVAKKSLSNTPIPDTIQPTITKSVETLTPKPLITITPDIKTLITKGIIGAPLVATLGEKQMALRSQFVLFSNDNKFLVSSYMNTVFLWNVETYKLIYKIEIPNAMSVNQLVFSPDSKFLASKAIGSVSSLNVWDISNGHQIITQALNEGESPNNTGDYQFVFSPDSKFLAAVATNPFKDVNFQSNLYVWNITNGQQIISQGINKTDLLMNSPDPYHLAVNAITFFPNSDRLAVASGNTIRIIDLQSPSTSTTVNLGSNIFASNISFSIDGRFMYVLMDWLKDHGWPSEWRTQYVIQIWDTKSFALHRTIKTEVSPGDEDWGLRGSSYLKYVPAKGTLELISLENDKVIPLPNRMGSENMGWYYLTPDNKFIIYVRYFGFDKPEDQGIEFWNVDNYSGKVNSDTK
jgi:hypothetical protein